MAATEKVTAKAQFAAEIDGKAVVVLQGARFDASHPVVKAHPRKFDRPAKTPRKAK